MRLISVVGDDVSQLVPVMYAYRRECREHWLVCDQVMSDQAHRLAQGMARFSNRYHLQNRVG